MMWPTTKPKMTSFMDRQQNKMASNTTTLDERNHLTVEKAKVALSDILNAFTTPENSTRLEEAKDQAGNDMIKIMQVVFPVVTQIQMEVIQNYGFTSDAEGAIQFAECIRSLEKQDTEVLRLNAEIRSHFIPQMIPQLPCHPPTSSPKVIND